MYVIAIAKYWNIEQHQQLSAFVIKSICPITSVNDKKDTDKK